MTRPMRWLVLAILAAPAAAWAIYRFAKELGFLDPPEKDGPIGRLGSYEILEVIGRGGMGVVLKAHDPSLNRFVAIKVLAPHLSGTAAARRRFAREARAALKLAGA